MLSAAAPRERARDGTIALVTLGVAATGAAVVGRSTLETAVGETLAAWPGMAILATLTVAIFALVELIDRTGNVDAEWTRKLGHVGAGAVALLAPTLLRSHWPMLALTAGFAVLLLAARSVNVLAPLHPKGRRGAGDLTYPAGLYAAFVLAGPNALAFRVGVLILALADPAATLAGRRSGRGRFELLGTPRSLPGSAAFALVATFAAAALLVASGGAIAPSLARASAVATATTVAEAISPSGLDNLTIPVVAVVAVVLLAA